MKKLLLLIMFLTIATNADTSTVTIHNATIYSMTLTAESTATEQVVFNGENIVFNGENVVY